jgi:hypothetical protein
MEWHPATIAEVKRILEVDLTVWDDQKLAAHRQYLVEPRFTPLMHYGKVEKVEHLALTGYFI